MPSQDAAIPSHVGLIPDGTRRWAAREGVALEDAYDQAFTRVANMLDQLWGAGVQAISVYMLSRKNLQRDPSELMAVYKAEAAICTTAFADAATAHDARAKIVGDVAAVPAFFSEALRTLTSESRRGHRRLYLLVAYDPIAELARATARPTALDLPLDGFDVPEPLDLVLRTSGVRSLSDFLPVQASYAELYFLRPLINDLTAQQLRQALRCYARTERRRGA